MAFLEYVIISRDPELNKKKKCAVQEGMTYIQKNMGRLLASSKYESQESLEDCGNICKEFLLF
jgi:F0F1-type ATP synthase epsilon subunit